MAPSAPSDRARCLIEITLSNLSNSSSFKRNRGSGRYQSRQSVVQSVKDSSGSSLGALDAG
jgi:hypothetical protein